jgi:hypothetical protein
MLSSPMWPLRVGNFQRAEPLAPSWLKDEGPSSVVTLVTDDNDRDAPAGSVPHAKPGSASELSETSESG